MSDPTALPKAPLTPVPPTDPTEMSVIEHLEELRWRIIWSAAAILVGAILVFAFNHPIIELLKRPLGPDAKLIFTTPAEYFMAVIKVSLLGGLYLASPIVLYHTLAFVGPGLLPSEKKFALPTVIGSFVFFTLGAVFGYYMILPAGLQFLIGFAPSDVSAMLSIGKYLSFAAGTLFATGLTFELPLFLLLASAIGVVTSYTLAKYRRYALLASFVLATLVSPSVDMFSQSMMAVALYGLYELSILMIRLTGR